MHIYHIIVSAVGVPGGIEALKPLWLHKPDPCNILKSQKIWPYSSTLWYEE